MIIEKESEIKVLRNFCDNPFDYFSIAEISGKAGISRNWAYRVIGKLEKFEILEKSGKKFKLDFSVLFCKKLKLLFDSEHLSSLDKKTRNNVFSMANKIVFEMEPESVVLVGSVALNKQKQESDIDFLVIGERKEIPRLENCNLIVISEKEFKEKYLKGDDFIVSALLFGKIVFDENTFVKFFESPLPIFSQQVIQEKIKYCEKLEERIYALLKTDEEKARQELLYLALQSARIVLLKNKIAPKTKHDIAEQVRPFNKKLSETTKQLLKKQKPSKEKTLTQLKTCLSAIG